MKQQYIVLRKENDLLNSLIGKSFNQKSKFEAEKILSEIHSKAQYRSIDKMGLCYIVDNDTIMNVGGSSLLQEKKTGKIHSNLIMNNFGILLAALFKKFDPENQIVTVKDVFNVDQSVSVYGTAGIWTINNGNTLSIGVVLKVGSGITPPIRTNFEVETAFLTAPESGNMNATSDPVYNTGLANFKYVASISAGGSGTVNEGVLKLGLRRTGGGARVDTVCFRDILSPAGPFTIGQTIAYEFTVQI